MFIVAALYHFTRFKDHQKICGPLQDKCNLSGVTGSLLLAPEGINGTIAGSRRGIDNVIEYIKSLPGCRGIEHKESIASLPPFPRMKVKIKNWIFCPRLITSLLALVFFILLLLKIFLHNYL